MNVEKNKIHSDYLDMDFDVVTYPGDQGEVQIISHDALENIIHNQVGIDVGVKYDITEMHIADRHCVFRCTISDSNGRRIQAIGESMQASLDTDIAKMYPALMAAQRAFDRAVIRYLQFPSKVYSSLEGVDKAQDDEPVTTISVQDIPQDGEAAIAPAPINNGTTAAPQQRQATQPRQPVQQAQRTNANQTTTQNATKPAATKSEFVPDEKLGEVLYNIGKYRSEPKSLAWIWEHDNKCFDWIINSYGGTSTSGAQLRDHCKRYKALKEGAANG